MEDWIEDWSEFLRPEDLGRELTLKDYVAEHLAEFGPDADQERIEDCRQRLTAFKHQLQELEAPGDTWREWLQGTEPHMQSGGLALMRNEKIVWAVQTWIS